MDPFIIALLCVFGGVLITVVVPYLDKVRKGEVTFDYSYFVAMIVGLVVAAVALVPDNIDMTAKSLLMLVLAGCGIQWAGNFVNTQRIKMKKSK